MNFKEKQEVLINKLREKTLQGLIAWTEGIEKNTYQTSLPKTSIQIERTFDEDCVTYTVSIFNEEGKLIESFNQYDLNTTSTLFSEIYDNARRIALGADKILDDVLASLEA